MKRNIHYLMAGSLTLTVILAAGCARESKGPRVHNHPPAPVGPPAALSHHAPPPAEAAPAAYDSSNCIGCRSSGTASTPSASLPSRLWW